MRKQNKERHSKTWTLIRLIIHIGILLLEVFGAYLLLLFIQEPIAHLAYMIFLVLPSVTTVAVYWNNYKKKNFKSMIEEDLEVDQMWAEQYGATYYIWKALTLPFIRKKGTQDINKEIVDICVNVILEREELKKQLKVSDDALELVCKEHSKLYCEHYCHKEPCGQCENGDYMFFKDNFLEIAKEKKSE